MKVTSFPVLARWAFNGEGKDANDPFRDGEGELIVLFTDQRQGIALKHTERAAFSFESEYWVNIADANWKLHNKPVKVSFGDLELQFKGKTVRIAT